MRLKILSISSFNRLFILSLIVMSGTINAADFQSGSDSDTNGEIMGKVEYKLPDTLGTLTFELPSHWVGARAEGVEVLWINQNAELFKDNVTLKIRDVKKAADADQLLDLYIERLVAEVDATSVSDAEKTTGRRSISFERTIDGHEITQNILVIYTESSEQSHLLILNHSRMLNSDPVDMSAAKIIASENNVETVGRAEFKLPDKLGTLTFEVPTHWIGTNAEDVDALWIDPDGGVVKDNVTLKIHVVDKISDSEKLLDIYIDDLVSNIDATLVSDIQKTPGRRSMSFDATIGGHDIKQHMLWIYTESSDKSYLLSLTNTHPPNSNPLDLNVTIN